VKRYLGILIEDIVLDGKQVTIRVKNEGILGLLEQEGGLNSGRVTPVLNSVYKWRPKCTAVKYSIHSFECCDNLLYDNILRFNPIQIGEWLNELWEQKFHSQYKLADDVGMSRVRVQQYLYLMGIPADLRRRLRTVPGLTEEELRPLTQMDGRAM
jgi:hypothetical protein